MTRRLPAYREGKLPFRGSTVIARLVWNYVPSEENDKVFRQPQSFVAGVPKEGVQLMVKDSSKYPSSGGWGFAEFIDGKPIPQKALNDCFSCHLPAKASDLFSPITHLGDRSGDVPQVTGLRPAKFTDRSHLTCLFHQETGHPPRRMAQKTVLQNGKP